MPNDTPTAQKPAGDGRAPSVHFVPPGPEDKGAMPKSMIIALEQGITLNPNPKSKLVGEWWWFPKAHLNMYSMASETTLLLKFPTHRVTITCQNAMDILVRILQEKQVSLSAGKDGVTENDVTLCSEQYSTDPQ